MSQILSSFFSVCLISFTAASTISDDYQEWPPLFDDDHQLVYGYEQNLVNFYRFRPNFTENSDKTRLGRFLGTLSPSMKSIIDGPIRNLVEKIRPKNRPKNRRLRLFMKNLRERNKMSRKMSGKNFVPGFGTFL